MGADFSTELVSSLTAAENNLHATIILIGSTDLTSSKMQVCVAKQPQVMQQCQSYLLKLVV